MQTAFRIHQGENILFFSFQQMHDWTWVCFCARSEQEDLLCLCNLSLLLDKPIAEPLAFIRIARGYSSLFWLTYYTGFNTDTNVSPYIIRYMDQSYWQSCGSSKINADFDTIGDGDGGNLSHLSSSTFQIDVSLEHSHLPVIPSFGTLTTRSSSAADSQVLVG